MIDKVYAVTLKEQSIGTITPPGPKDFTIADMVSIGVQVVMLIAGLWAFVKIIMGAFKILSSSGDAQKVAEGRQTIIYALIGLMLVLASWGIIVLIETIFNIGFGFSKEVMLQS